MSTLIEVRHGTEVVGRCDAKCYDATGPDCNCICGGKNHGAGKTQAEENTREMGEKWLDQYKDGHPDAKGAVNPEIFQLKLF